MYVSRPKDEAVACCKKMVAEFCLRRGIPLSKFTDSSRCYDWFSKITHDGLEYRFTTWCRYLGDEKQYMWDENNPGWRENHQDTIRVEWVSIQRPHDCPDCECVHELDGQETIIVP